MRKISIFLTIFMQVCSTLIASDLTPAGTTVMVPQTTAPYLINLMWVNEKLDPDQPHVINKNEKEVAKLCEDLKEWSVGNPGVKVIFWFDGNHVSKNAVDATATMLKDTPGGERVQFCDIRTLEHFASNPDLLSETLPVYFRADLARLVVLWHFAQTTEVIYTIYVDIDVPPMTKDQLFDKQMIEDLNTQGFVLAHSDTTIGNYENQFLALNTRNSEAVRALQEVINLDTHRAKWALKNGYYPDSIGKRLGNPMKPLTQIAFDDLQYMFSLYYVFKDKLPLLELDARPLESHEFFSRVPSRVVFGLSLGDCGAILSNAVSNPKYHVTIEDDGKEYITSKIRPPAKKIIPGLTPSSFH